MTRAHLELGLVLVSLASSGCARDEWDVASCPPDGTELSYENFGETFLNRHCQSCHASDAKERDGAPGAYVFDTRDDVVDFIDRIYERSAGDNTSMPPGPDDPSEEEREALAEWLACGAP